MQRKVWVFKPVSTVDPIPLETLEDSIKNTSDLSLSRGEDDGDFMHKIPVCYWIKEACRALSFGSSDFYYTLAPYVTVARRNACRQSVTGIHTSSFQSVEVNATRGRVRHEQCSSQLCTGHVNKEFKGGKWLSNI